MSSLKRSEKVFKKSRQQKATGSKFHSEAPKALIATVKKSSRPGNLTAGVAQLFIFFLEIHKFNFFHNQKHILLLLLLLLLLLFSWPP